MARPKTLLTAVKPFPGLRVVLRSAETKKADDDHHKQPFENVLKGSESWKLAEAAMAMNESAPNHRGANLGAISPELFRTDSAMLPEVSYNAGIVFGRKLSDAGEEETEAETKKQKKNFFYAALP